MNTSRAKQTKIKTIPRVVFSMTENIVFSNVSSSVNASVKRK